MLNMRLGGGVMDAVNEGQKLYGQDRHEIAAMASAVSCPPCGKKLDYHVEIEGGLPFE